MSTPPEDYITARAWAVAFHNGTQWGLSDDIRATKPEILDVTFAELNGRKLPLEDITLALIDLDMEGVSNRTRTGHIKLIEVDVHL